MEQLGPPGQIVVKFLLTLKYL